MQPIATKKRIRTLQELADLLDLSRATVSRALNDSPLIAEATRARVKQAAAIGGFSPNEAARRLTQGRSRAVAFVTHGSEAGPDLGGLMAHQILDGVARKLATLGYATVLKPVDYRDYSWVRSMIDGGQVDGFILLTSTRKAAHVQKLVDEKVPFVTWGPGVEDPEIPSVEGDDRLGGRLAGEHLRHHEAVAELAGPWAEAEVLRRSLGFREGLGVGAPDWSHETDWSEESAWRWAQAALGSVHRPRAVFCHSDRLAYGVLRAAGERGLRVPDALAVVGYDNLVPSAWTAPPLTTVDPQLVAAGESLGQALVDLIDTGAVTHTVLEPRLVVRLSA